MRILFAVVVALVLGNEVQAGNTDVAPVPVLRGTAVSVASQARGRSEVDGIEVIPVGGSVLIRIRENGSVKEVLMPLHAKKAKGLVKLFAGNQEVLRFREGLTKDQFQKVLKEAPDFVELRKLVEHLYNPDGFVKSDLFRQGVGEEVRRIVDPRFLLPLPAAAGPTNVLGSVAAPPPLAPVAPPPAVAPAVPAPPAPVVPAPTADSRSEPVEKEKVWGFSARYGFSFLSSGLEGTYRIPVGDFSLRLGAGLGSVSSSRVVFGKGLGLQLTLAAGGQPADWLELYPYARGIINNTGFVTELGVMAGVPIGENIVIGTGYGWVLAGGKAYPNGSHCLLLYMRLKL